MKRFTTLLVSMLLLVGVIAAPVEHMSRGEVESPVASRADELARRVTIRRDKYGIPHILGSSEEAAAFGFGFAQAEDHAIEIARRFIGGRGEMAKHFGVSVEADILIKRFNNAEAAQKGFKELSPFFQRIVEAYVAGVNHYIAKNRSELPSWIPTFRPEDVLANSRSGALRSLVDPVTIRALRRKHEPGFVEPAANPSQASADDLARLDEGSNAFALGPRKTTSGKSIPLGNPHLNWSSLYWEAHVTVPGRLNFFGSTLVGIPVLRAGFNDHLGWVTTNNNPDLDDIYALRRNPKDADGYIFEGQPRKLSKKEVTVEVLEKDGSLRKESRVFWESHLGPIIYMNDVTAFSVRSTSLDSFRLFEGFYRLSRTQNLREWLDVMKLNLQPTSNYTYADAAGNILYLWNGKVPRRVEDGTDYTLDVPADDSRYVWKTLHAVTELPRLLNPPAGYIQNCNNPPWYVSVQDPLDPRKYPSYFERGELALRPQMALEMLESERKFSFESVRALKYNTKMLVADRVKGDLVRALKARANRTDDLNRGLALMEGWDNHVSATSRGAVLFQRFWDQYRAAVKQPYATAWSSRNPARTPAGLADLETAIRVFEEAVEWTRTTYGSADVAWGDVHRFQHKDIDLPADGASGVYGLFRVMGFREQPNGKRVAGWVEDGQPLVGFGDAWVLAVEFSRPLVAYSVLAYGQTTNSRSPHSLDHIRLFANHSYKRIWFRESEIKANLEKSYSP